MTSSNVVSKIIRFLTDRSGAVAVTAAFMILGLFVATGMAVDYAVAVRDRTSLQNASDAAALAASRAVTDYIGENGWSSSTASAAVAVGIAAAKASVEANTAKGTWKVLPTVDTSMNIASASNVSATVRVAAAAPTSLLKVIGVDKVDISATATANASVPTRYFQFVVLVDISGSMGIGGTAAEISRLEGSAKYDNCGFACHNPSGLYSYISQTTGRLVSKDYRAMARRDGIKLKIDYVASALQSFFGSLDAVTRAGGSLSTSVHTFGTGFSTVLSNGSTAAAAVQAASTIDIEPIQSEAANWGYTKTTAALSSVKNALRNVGDGTSATARKTFVVFLTDGMEVLPGAYCPYKRCGDVAYTTACTAIKNTGATLITVEAPYPKVTADDQYTQVVAPYASQFEPVLKSCASTPQWYFTASDGPAIQQAMGTIVGQITRSLRLTN